MGQTHLLDKSAIYKMPTILQRKDQDVEAAPSASARHQNWLQEASVHTLERHLEDTFFKTRAFKFKDELQSNSFHAANFLPCRELHGQLV